MATATDIINFISHFHGSEDTFLHGCCYWFARILEAQFGWGHANHIAYDPIEGHFMFMIYLEDTSTGAPSTRKAHLFDVRGDVTSLYNLAKLYALDDIAEEEPNWYRNLMKDCKDFLPREEEESRVGA